MAIEECAVHHYPAGADLGRAFPAGKSARGWRERDVAWESGRDDNRDPVRFSRVRLGGSGGGEGACT